MAEVITDPQRDGLQSSSCATLFVASRLPTTMDHNEPSDATPLVANLFERR